MTTDLDVLLADPAAIDVIQGDPLLSAWVAARGGSRRLAYLDFVPRPDRPEEFDQQHSFVYNRDQVGFLLKGNGSGGSSCAAHKTARFLLEQQPPPRRDTPFWICSNTYEQCCGVAWVEKLFGDGHLPPSEVDWPRVAWLDSRRGFPRSVPLRPWPTDRGGDPGKNWVIEFKSYEQGRQNMQARSIGGFWFSEQFPWEVFVEVFRGCRDYLFPGGQFCEFTPIDPELCVAIENLMDDPPPGWAFYRGNTRCNTALARDWLDQFFAAVPDEMLATRQTGALANFQGAIYQSFAPALHVVDNDDFLRSPGLRHYRGVDWGASEEHAQTCVWGCRDAEGSWFVYDEYWSTAQDCTVADHAAEIVARSIAWGWPTPEAIVAPSEATRYVAAKVIERTAAASGRRPIQPGAFFDYSCGDSAGLAEIRQFNSFGIPTAPAAKDVLAGIDLVRSLLKVNPFSGRPKLFIHRRCQHLVEELRKYRWDPKRLAKPQPLKKDDDTADALRYMLYSASRETDQPISSFSTAPAPKGWHRSLPSGVLPGQAPSRRFRR